MISDNMRKSQEFSLVTKTDGPEHESGDKPAQINPHVKSRNSLFLSATLVRNNTGFLSPH